MPTGAKRNLLRFTEPRGSPLPEIAPVPDVVSMAQEFHPWMLNDIFKQNLFSAKSNLVLSDGADRGKVNIDADYLSVEGLGLNAVDLTADLAVSGTNGLDTGAEAADTWYAVWVIASTTGSRVASLLSLSGTAPTLPAEYSLKRRVGWVRNNAASDLFRFYHYGDWWYWNEVLAASPFRVLAAGSATAFTGVSCASVVPTTSRVAMASTAITAGVGTAFYFATRPTGSNLADDAATRIGNTIVPAVGQINYRDEPTLMLDSSQSFDYLVNDADHDLDIHIRGYLDVV